MLPRISFRDTPPRDSRHRARFWIVRACELDMRCCTRDMQERRLARNTVGRLLEAKRRGEVINEVELSRARFERDTLGPKILERFERLYRRMTRELARLAQMEIDQKNLEEIRRINKVNGAGRADRGVAAHP